jgi:hypothetical protein
VGALETTQRLYIYFNAPDVDLIMRKNFFFTAENKKQVQNKEALKR